MKKLCFIAVLLLAISCNEDQPLKKESLVDSFLKSSAFTDLKISLTELEVSNAQITEVDLDTKSILIPLKGNLKYVISRVHLLSGQPSKFKSAFTFEYVTNLNYEQLSESLKNKDYTGKFEVRSNQDDSFLFTITNGKFESIDSKINKSSRLNNCSGSVGSNAWIQDVASCAAGRMDDLNTLFWLGCMADVVRCWGSNVVSCIIDGCIQ